MMTNVCCIDLSRISRHSYLPICFWKFFWKNIAEQFQACLGMWNVWENNGKTIPQIIFGVTIPKAWRFVERSVYRHIYIYLSIYIYIYISISSQPAHRSDQILPSHILAQAASARIIFQYLVFAGSLLYRHGDAQRGHDGSQHRR